jgi:hypothetical protein
MSLSINTEPQYIVNLTGGNCVKKTAATFIILAVTMVFLGLASFSVASARASSNYSIESVNHTVGVLYNGYVLINDTIAISGQADSFLLGLPHAFGPSIVKVIAYSANDTSNVFPVALNVPLEDRAGFYGVKVDFPRGTPQVFSVVFVLSKTLLSQDPTNATMFTLVFPAFPSLTETTPVCNSSVVVPGAQYLEGTVNSLTYSAENLSAFTYNTSQVTFLLPSENIQIFEIKQLTREVNINEFGQTSVSDAYYVTNNSTYTMYSIEIIAPPDASSLDAHDELGRELAQPVLVDVNPTRYRINFTETVAANTVAKFTVDYDLPSNVYVRKLEANNFALNVTFFQDTNTFINQASVSFVLPEGARLSSFGTTSAGNSYSVNRDVFQETMSVNLQNVVSLDGFAVSLSYVYNPLWLAFRPTMLIWAVVIVGAVVVVAWKRPKAPGGAAVPSTTLRLRPEDVRSFVDAYDEKMKIESEIDLLEAKVQKGKIPRSRYKVQKKTLEIRLSTLDRNLAESGGRIHSAGGHFSDLMRQLEVAETEIDGVEANMKSIEARQGRGEISLETYRKLLGDYERRKDKAKTSINGILLRLREEIR